jgi:hypothetical protein
MAQPPSLEFPTELRELAENNVRQARAAYGQFLDAMAQGMAMWATAMPTNHITSGFQSVQDRAVHFRQAERRRLLCIGQRTRQR